MIAREVIDALLGVVLEGGRVIVVEDHHRAVEDDLRAFSMVANGLRYPIVIRTAHGHERVEDPETHGVIHFTTARSVATYGGARGWSADVVYLTHPVSRGGLAMDAAGVLRACLASSPIGEMIAE